MQNNHTLPNYFNKFIKVAPFSHALWRSQEALTVAKNYVLLNKKYRWVKSAQSLKFRRPILDLGCGFGEFSGVFFDSQIEMGIDINIDDLIRANKIKKYHKLMAADARKLPFKDRTFATVVSISVLEHISGVNKAIQETYRVLKRGGVLIITLPTKELNNNLFFPGIFKKLNFERLSDWYIRNYHQVFKHKYVLAKEDWLNMVKSSGFKIIHHSGTINKLQSQIYDLFLLSALPSQILRLTFGVRGIWTSDIKAKLTEKIYKYSLKNNKYNDSNVLIIAVKP